MSFLRSLNPFRRRNRRRRRNPAATTWALIAATGAAALGVIIGGFTYYRKRKALPTGPVEPPIDEPKPGGGGGGGGGGGPIGIPVIGGTWTDWPGKDKYGTQSIIANNMLQNGYWSMGDWAFYEPNGPKSLATDPTALAAVGQFQKDWNAVAKKGNWGILFPENIPLGDLCSVQGRPVGNLSADDLIGPNTWKAMRFVFDKNLPSAGTTSWQDKVKAAKAGPLVPGCP